MFSLRSCSEMPAKSRISCRTRPKSAREKANSWIMAEPSLLARNRRQVARLPTDHGLGRCVAHVGVARGPGQLAHARLLALGSGKRSGSGGQQVNARSFTEPH